MARNFSFLKSKRFWILLAAGVAGIFAIFFLQRETQPLLSGLLFPRESTDRVASFLYLYDAKERAYIPETSEGWQNKDFIRHVFDVSEDSSITQCSYFVYDTRKGEMRVSSERKCNAPIAITVGEQGVCSSEGNDSCVLYVYAVDEQGRMGEVGVGTYSIDYHPPRVDRIFLQENQIYPILVKKDQEVTYTISASDNVGMFGCWLYGEEQLIGPMQLSLPFCIEDHPCGIVATYKMLAGEERQLLWAQCVDHYNIVGGQYLNVGYGQAVEVLVPQNHPPQITSCRVTPAQGTKGTEFVFEAEVRDPDGEQVGYQWEFGDGDISIEETPRYRYKNTGVFQPKVVVQDGRGEAAECSTAWVVVE